MADANDITKMCGKCKQNLPHSAFWKSSSTYDGLQPACRSCQNEQRRARAAADPEKVKARRLADSEKQRERVRKWAENNPERKREGRKAWRAANRERVRATDRARYALNQEDIRKRKRASRQARLLADPLRVRAQTRAWAAVNPERALARVHKRRARIANAGGKGWTAEDVAEIKAAQKNHCAICRKRLPEKFHRDHIIPIALGGEHSRRNLQLTCAPCNQSKGSRDPIYHARTLGLLL